MASTNQSPEYIAAQKQFYLAATDEQKILALEEMMKYMPKHKAGESLRKNIRTRYKKLKQEILRKQKVKKRAAGKEGIRKEGVQVALIGFANSGKSSVLSSLTNASPEIQDYKFTTKSPILGTLYYQGLQFQVIDMPAVNYETFDQGIANTADILLIIIDNINEIKEIKPFLEKTRGKQIVIYNKSDILNPIEKRKLEATLRSKKLNFSIISTKTGAGLQELKALLLSQSGMIRIYTKQPHHSPDSQPVIMKPGSNVHDVVERILKKGIKIKEVRITGPSSKFSNQVVGLKHELKDKDIIEIHTS